MAVAADFTFIAIGLLSIWGCVVMAEDEASIDVSVVLKNGAVDVVDVSCKFAPGDDAVAGGTRPLRSGENMEINFRSSIVSRESLICAFHLLGKHKKVQVPVWLSPLEHGELCDSWKFKCSNACTWDMLEDGLYVRVGATAYKCREWGQ